MAIDTLFVKNMICGRCLLAVENILQRLSIRFQKITIGEIHPKEKITDSQLTSIRTALAAIGLELIDNKTSGLVEKIKQIVIRKARNEISDEDKKIKLSSYLSQKLHHEYTYLSSLFSSVEGRTIENYFIQQRIEKVKELLVYNEMTLLEISFELDYSSVAHLSSQFKQITGLTPSHFKKIGSAKRQMLDRV